VTKIAQTLLLFLVMGAAALAVGWRLGRAASNECAPDRQPDQAQASDNMNSGQGAEQRENDVTASTEDEPEKPKGIMAIAEDLAAHHSRCPSPQAFIDSDRLSSGRCPVALRRSPSWFHAS
jgi:hypothetical protein